MLATFATFAMQPIHHHSSELYLEIGGGVTGELLQNAMRHIKAAMILHAWSRCCRDIKMDGFFSICLDMHLVDNADHAMQHMWHIYNVMEQHQGLNT